MIFFRDALINQTARDEFAALHDQYTSTPHAGKIAILLDQQGCHISTVSHHADDAV